MDGRSMNRTHTPRLTFHPQWWLGVSLVIGGSFWAYVAVLVMK